MELAYYVLLSVCAFLLALAGVRRNSRRVDLFWFVLLMGFSVVVRETPNIDILVYFAEMHATLQEVASVSSYLQEFSYWGVSSILYSLIGNERWVFYLWDALAICILLGIRRRLSLGWYFVPFFFVAFPSVLGFQNVYRQFLASLMVLNATSYCLALQRKRYWKVLCFVFFILAVTIHKSTWIFLPVLAFVYGSVEKKRRIFMLLFIVFALLSPFVLVVRGRVLQNGLNLGFAYLGVVIVLVTTLLLSRVKVKEGKLDVVSTRFIFFYVAIFAIVGLIQMGSDIYYERMMLLFIPQILVLLLWSIEDRAFRKRRFVVLTILLLFIIPSYAFSSSYAMITNQRWIDEDVPVEHTSHQVGS